MKKTLYIILSLLILESSAYAGYTQVGSTYIPDTCGHADVQLALTAAAADAVNSTVTVSLPSCASGAWSTKISIASATPTTLIFTGQGNTSTIINDTGTGASALEIAMASGKTLEIKDFALNINEGAVHTAGAFDISGGLTYKIHGLSVHSNASGTSSAGVRSFWLGDKDNLVATTGVLYNNHIHITFNGTSSAIAILYPNTTWPAGNPDFGATTGHFIEYNEIIADYDNDESVDAYGPVKATFRYNTVDGIGIGFHGYDSGGYYSPYRADIYNNRFISTRAGVEAYTFNIRGGTAYFHNNYQHPTYFPKGVELTYYRSCWTSLWGGRCDGDAAEDENSDASGWRCYQQPGTTGADSRTTWPVISWGNTLNEIFNNPNFLAAACTVEPFPTYGQEDHMKAERDFISLSICTDTVDNDGDGLTDAADPQCATFWDYTNGIANGYTPPTCPHPLAGVGSCSSTAGTAGYRLGGLSLGSGPAFTFTGPAITVN